MNPYITLNWSFTQAILVALAVGLKDQLRLGANSITHALISHPTVVLYCLYFIVLRIKFAFDDHKYFGENQQDKSVYRAITFILIVSSWLLMVVSAYNASNPRTSALVLAAALFLSTVCVVVHVVEIGILIGRPANELIIRRRAQIAVSELRQEWIYINLTYIALLTLYRYVGSPIFVVMAIGLLLYDIVRSKTFSNVLPSS